MQTWHVSLGFLLHLGLCCLAAASQNCPTSIKSEGNVNVAIYLVKLNVGYKHENCCMCCIQVPPSTPGTKSVPATHEEEAEPEEAVIKPAPRFAKFDRNNFKCSRCLKVRRSKQLPHLALGYGLWS